MLVGDGLLRGGQLLLCAQQRRFLFGNQVNLRLHFGFQLLELLLKLGAFGFQRFAAGDAGGKLRGLLGDGGFLLRQAILQGLNFRLQGGDGIQLFLNIALQLGLFLRSLRRVFLTALNFGLERGLLLGQRG